MKLKLSIIAAAVAMSVSGLANASVVDGSTGNGELFLSVWDSTNQTSYIRGLGVEMNTWLANAGVVTGTSAAAFTAGNDANSYSLAADANLTSFLGSVAAGDQVQWSVVAFDTTGLGYAGRRFLFTSNSGLANIAQNVNGQTGNMAGGNANYLISANSMIGGVGNDMTSMKTTAAAGGLAYPDAASNGFGNNFGSYLQYATNTSAVGVSQNFYFLTPSSTSGLATSTAYQFSNASGASTFNLASNGTLTYSVASTVAAVPEPGEWALMLSGFGLFGFIAKRRQARMA